MSEQNQHNSDEWLIDEAQGDTNLLDLIIRREEFYLNAAQIGEHRSGYYRSGDEAKLEDLNEVLSAINERKDALGIDRSIEP